MQFHTAKLFLYQVAFFERSLQHNPALNLTTLCEGLESAKAFLDLYLWLPPKSEMNLTNSEWIQLNFGVTLAAKFAIVSKDPNIEPQTRELRHRLNIDNVFRHLSLRIGALVGRSDDGSRQKDIFAYYEHRVRKIQNWYERMCRATGSDSPSSQPTHTLPLPGPSTQDQSGQLLTQPVTLRAPPPQYASVPATGYSPVSPQPPMTYSNGPSPVSSVGMTPTQSHYTTGYTPAPMLAFPDLMNAPGWDMPFTIPMEDNSWMYDPAVGYPSVNMNSPPSDGTWGSPPGVS